MNAPLEPPAPSRRAGLSLRWKLGLLAVAASLVPATTLGWVLSRRAEQIIESNLAYRFQLVVDSVATSVDRTLESTRTALDAVARTLADDTASIDRRVAVAAGVVAALDAVERVGIYDEDGALIDTVAVDGAPADAMPATLAAPERGRARDQGSAISVVEGHQALPRALLVVPVPGSAATWYVASFVPLAPIQHRLEELTDLHVERLAGRQHRFADESIALVDDQKRVLAHSNRERLDDVGTSSTSELLRDQDPRGLAKVMYLRSRLDDSDTVGAVQKLASLPWFAVVELPSEVAYAELHEMQAWLWKVIAAVLLLAVLAGLVQAGRLTAPIHTLVSFAEDLAARRFDRRVHLRTGDELGLLGDAMSDAARQLEESEARIARELEIRADLGRYLPERLVDNIVAREQTLALGGERRRITVLFADVAGFTPMAEKHPAEDVVTILNQLFTILTEIVFRHGGTVDKFIGDSVMAFWGAPDAQPDHAALALAAAEDMLSWLEVGNENWEREFGAHIELAIGINTGEAVVGNFGSETRMEYTVVGDTVNVAARLENIARPQQILVSAATREAAGDDFEYVALGEHKVAGKSDPIELYEVRP
ncbi:adenylate/guanylate cyclase domain-containing protein [Haliangium sp.]|uniref:adenylate/guanylate cyclase domain-containing protein n=1 Tax=Haliangium sp. TaxID=2663208 RepID=UPI003D0BA92B